MYTSSCPFAKTSCKEDDNKITALTGSLSYQTGTFMNNEICYYEISAPITAKPGELIYV
jgi:hypothetical protein